MKTDFKIEQPSPFFRYMQRRIERLGEQIEQMKTFDADLLAWLEKQKLGKAA